MPRQVYLLLIKPAFAGRTLQTFRHLHACSGCFRLERLPGACTRWKDAAFSRRTPQPGICERLLRVSTLDSLLEQGWDDHAIDAAAVAARLPEGLPLVQDDDDAMGLASLAHHVLGEHLRR